MFVPMFSNLVVPWSDSDWRGMYNRFASFSRLIMLDKRGTGPVARYAFSSRRPSSSRSARDREAGPRGGFLPSPLAETSDGAVAKAARRSRKRAAVSAVKGHRVTGSTVRRRRRPRRSRRRAAEAPRQRPPRCDSRASSRRTAASAGGSPGRRGLRRSRRGARPARSPATGSTRDQARPRVAHSPADPGRAGDIRPARLPRTRRAGVRHDERRAGQDGSVRYVGPHLHSVWDRDLLG